MAVAVVTDSTAYLLAEAAAQVTVVPLHVVLGGVAGREGVDISPAEVAAALMARRVSVSTSQPTPAEFEQVYRRLLDDGAEGVVSVHLSSKLSGTFGGASLAAAEVGGPIAVIDSESAGMGVGFPALAAARAAAAGKDLATVRAAAADAIENTAAYFYVDTLEHLRRGGRITAASALLGTALAVKPLLQVAEGRIVLKDKVRTAGKALARLVELAVESSGSGPVELAVHHLVAPERAEAVATALHDRLGAQIRALHVTEIGAAVAAHVGPGLVGVVAHRLAG